MTHYQITAARAAADQTPPRMRIVWSVLEAAKDCQDEMVIAACRRLIVANRLGWKKHRAKADWTLVQAFHA
jgi:hypothetical protein